WDDRGSVHVGFVPGAGGPEVEDRVSRVRREGDSVPRCCDADTSVRTVPAGVEEPEDAGAVSQEPWGVRHPAVHTLVRGECTTSCTWRRRRGGRRARGRGRNRPHRAIRSGVRPRPFRRPSWWGSEERLVPTRSRTSRALDCRGPTRAFPRTPLGDRTPAR